jgi:hypothetical protein
MKKPKGEIKLLDSKTGEPLRIVADGGIASRGVVGGRMIPLVILDTSNRPDVEELIRVHNTLTTPGDVIAQWGEVEGSVNSVILLLRFIRPSEVTFVIEFDVIRQGILVDQALLARGLYIQAGRDGDRLKYDVNRPKVFLEVVDTGYLGIWEHTFVKIVAAHFRTKGLSRSQSRRAAVHSIAQMRQVSSFRMHDLET